MVGFQAGPDKELSMKRPLEAKTVTISGYTRAMVKTMTSSLQIPHFGYKVRFRTQKYQILLEKNKISDTMSGRNRPRMIGMNYDVKNFTNYGVLTKFSTDIIDICYTNP